MKKIKNLLLVFGVFLAFPSFSNVRIVSNLSTSGPGSLQGEINSAINGDTVLVNVSGTLVISSSISVSSKSNLWIIGPYPAHFTISSTAGFSGDLFDINTSDNINIENIGFLGANTTSRAIRYNSNNSDMFVKNCLFENFSIAAEGGAIYYNGSNSIFLEVLNCSFLDNTATKGGAIFCNNGILRSINCSYISNVASSSGGGISIGGSDESLILHNTFSENNAGLGTCMNVSGTAKAIMKGNAGALNGISTDIQFAPSFGGYYLTDGGNAIKENTGGEIMPWGTGNPTDISVGVFTGLHASIVVDGYGLKYYTITDSNSTFCDRVSSIGIPLPPKDARRAPRALTAKPGFTNGGNLDASPVADAGACEYTQLRVINGGANDNIVGTLPWAIKRNYNYENYVEFDMAGDITITPLVTMTENGYPTYVDGFSQTNTIIPGPTAPAASALAPGNLDITISGGSGVSLGFEIGGFAANMVVAGIRIIDFSTDGIKIINNGVKVIGCQIGFTESNTPAPNGQTGISLSGGSNNIIGGNFHFERNTITGNGGGVPPFGSTNVLVSAGSSNLIFGNIIGLRPNGISDIAAVPSGSSGIVNLANETVIGSKAYLGGNIIGNHPESGILEYGATGTRIMHNTIGLRHTGLSIKPNKNGILLDAGASNILIGGVEAEKTRNVISGNSDNNVKFISATTCRIEGNYIGMDVSGNGAFVSPANVGVLIDGPTVSDVQIGGSTVAARNIIAGTIEAVRVHQSSNQIGIYNNYIGTESSGTGSLSGLLFAGIVVKPGAGQLTIGGAGLGNLISGFSNAGGIAILLDTASLVIVESNIIGLNAAGNATIPNTDGIIVNAGANNTIGGFGAGNTISANTQNGIHVHGGADGTIIHANIIGLDLAGTIAFGNGINGIKVEAADNTRIGSLGAGLQNVISGQTAGGAAGIFCDLNGANTMIENNYIGTDLNGTSPLGNETGIRIDGIHQAGIGIGNVNGINYVCASTVVGIHVSSENVTINGVSVGVGNSNTLTGMANLEGVIIDVPNVVIGPTSGIDNIFSNNTNNGIILQSDQADNCLIGNSQVGLLSSGIPAGNGTNGIWIDAGDDNIIGSATNNIGANVSDGVKISGNASGNLIQNNYIGNVFGVTGTGNDMGVTISAGAEYNAIGTASILTANTIGGNTTYGINISTDSNAVMGNFIGTDAANNSWPNSAGIVMANANGNIIGIDWAGNGLGNIVSNNTFQGINVCCNSNGNIFAGNKVGTNVAGTAVASNAAGLILDNSTGNQIGGSQSLNMGNTFSGNDEYGIALENASSNFVYGNYIGMNSLNSSGLDVQDDGIRIDGTSSNNQIGGDRGVFGNFIAGNVDNGIVVLGGSSNTIEGNLIGGVSNNGQNYGITLTGTTTTNNTIGNYPLSKHGNYIYQNAFAGIYIDDLANSNVIQTNSIGLDTFNLISANFTQPVGIEVSISSGINSLGLNALNGGNVISGNETGIFIDGATNQVIYNNLIGTDTTGLLPRGNIEAGIYMSNSATLNNVGGTAVYLPNVISGNNVGVHIEGAGTTLNNIIGNNIGLNLPMTDSIPNGIGVGIEFGASTNYVGSTASQGGNQISGNYIGVYLDNANSNEIINNDIGVLNSNTHGILIDNGATGTQIGGGVAERNIISGNDSMAVSILNSSGTIVEGNYIGLEDDGLTVNSNLIGVYTQGATNTQIGLVGANNGNIVSGNTLGGILMDVGSNTNSVLNNYIGTDYTGNLLPVGAQNGFGIFIVGSNLNVIGGTWTNIAATNEGNVIAGNAADGITLDNTTNTTITGNNIGLSRDNDNYIGNVGDGIFVSNNSNNNNIGAAGAGFGNVISDNDAGIHIEYSTANNIINNLIGTDDLGGVGTVSSGTNDQLFGVILDSGSVSNDIYGINIISGNEFAGVAIVGPTTTQNIVRGNYIGVDFNGSIAYSNDSTNVYIGEGAHGNLIGGSVSADRNILGGDASAQIIITGEDTDSNRIYNNFIGVGLDQSTTYITQYGVMITDSASFNNIGGGLSSLQGNFIPTSSSHGIYLGAKTAQNNIQGNHIGIKPNGSDGSIGGSGVRFHGSDFNKVGGILVNSDSANIITNAVGAGVDMVTYPLINSSYGNAIIGNSIYNNGGLGIDIGGDGTVEPNDATQGLGNNGNIDYPEIIESWNCGTNGYTHVGVKTFTNTLAGYRIEFYTNSTTDPSGHGEGETFLGSWTFNPTSNPDTLEIDLGIVLPVGTIISATVTGNLGNTSEFSLNDTVISAPIFNVTNTVDESCFGAANGYIEINDAQPLLASIDGGLTNVALPDTIFAPSGTYVVEATYINGCVLNETVTLNDGPALPFTYTVVPDTCGIGYGGITIDTVSTNAGGGSGSYVYTFSNGNAYLTSIDSLNILGGTYSVGLLDAALGCYSNMEAIVVPTITDVVDESFTYLDFCPADSPIPTTVATSGGTWSIDNGGVIDPSTGAITTFTVGDVYEIIYTVGICSEKDTVLVTAASVDDPTFVYPDFCLGTMPSISTVTPGGTWELVSGSGSIDISSGILTVPQGSYQVGYTTAGTCPDADTLVVVVNQGPLAPEITTADSLYCPNEVLQDLTTAIVVNTTYNWYDDPASGNSINNTSTLSPSNLQTGDNFFYLTATDVNGCVSLFDSLSYYLVDVSQMTAGPDMDVCLASTVELSASGGAQYSWTMSGQITDALDDSVTFAVINTVEEFYVEITDVFACVVNDTIRVSLLPADSCFIEVYNAFSPNGDGVNEFWHIDGIEGFPENQVYLYNRWGDKIMSFENYNNSDVIWDGRNKNGKIVAAGTYFYVVEVGGAQNQANWVQVSR